MSTLDDKIESAKRILAEAREKHDPKLTFPMFSGGHDSLVASHVAMEHGGGDCVVHINTGVGIPRTRTFVRRTAVRCGWPLLEYKARENTQADGTPDPQKYEELVMRWGFPGPPHHAKMYNRLKGRQIARLCRDFRDYRGQRFILATGLRRQESDRRMAYDSAIDRDGGKVWVNPIFEWTAEDCEQYRERHDLPSNPVKEKLCMSGECLCGAFAREGELAEIKAVAPDVGEWIEQLEDRVADAGFPWGWEERRPAWWDDMKEGQSFLPGTEPDELDQHLCTGCIAKHKNRQDADLDEMLDDIETEVVE